MRPRALSLAGIIAVLAACAAHAPTADHDRLREDALRRARVWKEPARPIGSADLAANPPGADSFAVDADVSCDFRLRASDGWSPKFVCTLPSGEEIKVKYGHNSVEVFGEVAATRLLSALGFGADRMYVVRSVRCRGCPPYPYPKLEVLDAAGAGHGREVTFTMAAIERKMPGRAIKGEHVEGWAWPELARIDPAAGGSSREEVDALRLMAAFLNHWDSKASNQRLVCLDNPPAADRCATSFALLQDVGETFGPRGVDLDGWGRTHVWSDAATCEVSMKDLPYHGATFGEAKISEGGRQFLGDRLRQLSHAQIVALFAGARFAEYARQSQAGRDPENWARAFEDRVRQIVERPPCPRPPA